MPGGEHDRFDTRCTELRLDQLPRPQLTGRDELLPIDRPVRMIVGDSRRREINQTILDVECRP